jgi:putative transposase
MRFTSSLFGKLLEPIDRRRFQASVDRHRGDAYGKSFASWDHLLALIYAQLSGADSLRCLTTSWNANSQHHYHLASRDISRSTMSDAGKRRPVAIFAELFAGLASQLDRKARQEGHAMLRLIDSTPIPLGKLYGWALSNGRIRGLKVHVVYDPQADAPRVLDITDATVNDVQVGRTVPLEAGATYVFDKGYCHYGWWTSIATAGGLFVTRPKTNMRLTLVKERPVAERPAAEAKTDGFTVLEDARVELAKTGNVKLPLILRRLRIRRHEPAQGNPIITLITNDLERPAAAIAALYKGRWQIELLFRWIKQHLRIRKFLGHTPNAIKLQIFAAMIAFALLRIAARTHCVALPILRFTDLVARCLFERRAPATIQTPPPTNPNRKRDRTSPHQLDFPYA